MVHKIRHRKGGFGIEVIVHFPKAKEDQEEIQKRIAKIHAQFVLQYVEKLNCPLEQKQQLIDTVVNTIRERARQEGNEG